jgi:acyl-[acyl-carrier-protein]-phospholipid O-acyltransferase / long-chain-fatty-acid--[acyl-carrier-protein] ligase
MTVRVAASPQTFRPASPDVTIFSALLEARRAHGGGKVILRDADGTGLTYTALVTRSLILGRALAKQLKQPGPVALMLPNVAALVVSVFGLNAYGRTVALLNYTSGARNLASALATGQIRQIVTSRRFVEKANLADLIEQLGRIEVAPGRHIEISYLEDLRERIGSADKLHGAIATPFAGSVARGHRLNPATPAVVLFTSGTEGAPKGVALTNANVVTNARQIFAHADGALTAADSVVNPLPMFHSFGLTAGTLMPILAGMTVVLYPSPLHYREIPKLIGEQRVTLLFATDTFLAAYAKAAKPGDFDTLRFVIAGAEKVKESTRSLWASTRAQILEGYGATECAPVIAVNIPTANQPGSVGRTLPHIETKVVPVEGIAQGGRLCVKGPNVMAGYILPELPGVVVPPQDGWHDTGDIVTIDDGFITIRGRAKRFAKLAGEMVSLAAVESLAATLWPEANHVVVALPDPKKGEQLILVTDKPDAGKSELLQFAQQNGFPELWVPRAILVVASIPVLGSGKTDLPATLEMVRQTRPML